MINIKILRPLTLNLPVDGNTLENIEVLADPDKNLKIIMKNGQVYKNTL